MTTTRKGQAMTGTTNSQTLWGSTSRTERQTQTGNCTCCNEHGFLTDSRYGMICADCTSQIRGFNPTTGWTE